MLTTRVNEFYFRARTLLLLDIGAEVGCEGLALGGGAVTLLPIVSVSQSDRSLRGGCQSGVRAGSLHFQTDGCRVDERIDEVTKTSGLR